MMTLILTSYIRRTTVSFSLLNRFVHRLLFVFLQHSSQPAALFTTFPSTFRVGINGQPCMVLQTRYFHLLDFSLVHDRVSIDRIVKEVSAEVYHAAKLARPNAYACAHEVAFDSKGKQSCNLSV